MIDNEKLLEIEEDYMKALSEVETLDDISSAIDKVFAGDQATYKLLLNTYMVKIPSLIETLISDDLDVVYLDLIQEGNYALLEFAQYYFDNHLKCDFDEYISSKIIEAVKDFINAENCYINLPKEDVDNLIRVVDCFDHLKHHLKRDPLISEIKDELKDLSEEKIAYYLEIKNS